MIIFEKMFIGARPYMLFIVNSVACTFCERAMSKCPRIRGSLSEQLLLRRTEQKQKHCGLENQRKNQQDKNVTVFTVFALPFTLAFA